MELWGILANTFTQGRHAKAMLHRQAHLRARFSGKAAEAVGERSSSSARACHAAASRVSARVREPRCAPVDGSAISGESIEIGGQRCRRERRRRARGGLHPVSFNRRSRLSSETSTTKKTMTATATEQRAAAVGARWVGAQRQPAPDGHGASGAKCSGRDGAGTRPRACRSLFVKTLADFVYIKPGFTKQKATLGVSMFEDRNKAILEAARRVGPPPPHPCRPLSSSSSSSSSPPSSSAAAGAGASDSARRAAALRPRASKAPAPAPPPSRETRRHSQQQVRAPRPSASPRRAAAAPPPRTRKQARELHSCSRRRRRPSSPP